MPLEHGQEYEATSEAARSPQPGAGGGAPNGAAKLLADLHSKLAAVTQMDAEQLRSEWRRWYRALPPSRLGRELLLLGVAWKIQEQILGGLSSHSARRLSELAKTMCEGGDLVRSRASRLRHGARLVREWQGEAIT